MITIPTSDLVGVLGDVIHFSDPDEENPITNALRLEWDGDMLHALATDRYVIGCSRWNADDAPADEQEALLPKWGGADNPWGITLRRSDAEDIIKNYKLGGKQGYVPVTLDCFEDRLRIKRNKVAGHSELTQDIDGSEFEFPNVRALLTATNLPDTIDGIGFDPKKLALFSKVRPRAHMHMTFTGTNKPTHVSIGERFTGAIMPFREKEEETTKDTPLEGTE